jgi:hypothetical protein
MPGFEKFHFAQNEAGLYVPEPAEMQTTTLIPVTREAYLVKLNEANETFRMVKDTESRYYSEMFAMNLDAIDNNLVLLTSTNASGATNNVGNVIELAATAAANPNTCYVYLAYPGNGRSSSFNALGRWHLTTTGRMTKGSVEGDAHFEALRRLQAMAHTVVKEFDNPQYVSGDTTGGRFGLGMMVALEKDTIRDAYFNGIPGISLKKSYAQPMLAEDYAGHRQREKRAKQQDSYRPGEINDYTIAEARKQLPRLYGGIDKKALLAWTYARTPLNALSITLPAFSRHNNLDELRKHAVFQDTLAALINQEAMITMQFNRDSRMHNIEECIRFGQLVMQHIPGALQSDKRGLVLLIGEGSLDEHTVSPGTRTAAERLGLSSITNFMRLILRGDGREVIEAPQPVVQEAA